MKLQIDLLPYLVLEYNVRKHRTIVIHRRNSRDRQQILNDDVSHKDRCIRAVQSRRLSTREQV